MVVGGMAAVVSWHSRRRALSRRTVGGRLASRRPALRPTSSQFRILKYSVISTTLQRQHNYRYDDPSRRVVIILLTSLRLISPVQINLLPRFPLIFTLSVHYIIIDDIGTWQWILMYKDNNLNPVKKSTPPSDFKKGYRHLTKMLLVFKKGLIVRLQSDFWRLHERDVIKIYII